VESIQVSREDEVTRRVLLNLKDPDKEVSISGGGHYKTISRDGSCLTSRTRTKRSLSPVEVIVGRGQETGPLHLKDPDKEVSFPSRSHDQPRKRVQIILKEPDQEASNSGGGHCRTRSRDGSCSTSRTRTRRSVSLVEVIVGLGHETSTAQPKGLGQ
jgi:hypothetical protein